MGKDDVAVIGAGRMGMALVKNLRRQARETWVYDITDSRLAVESQGGRWCASVRELADAASVVLVCVGYESQVEQVLFGEDGLLANAREGTLVAILSTISAEAMHRFAAFGRVRNVAVFDAPICRGGPAADSGTLLSLVGCSEDVFTFFEPVASCYSSDVLRIGDVGAGQVAKAANNLILWACLVADHEGLALASRFGVDPEILRRALMISSADNGALADWGTQTMAWAQDDMVIVSAMADSVGISLPQAGLNREICRALKPRRYELDQYGT